MKGCRHKTQEHFRRGDISAVADKLGGDPATLEWPDSVVEPRRKGHVIGVAPQQGHGRVAMRVD